MRCSSEYFIAKIVIFLTFITISKIYSILIDVGTPLRRRGVERVSVRRRWEVEVESVRMARKVESQTLRQR